MQIQKMIEAVQRELGVEVDGRPPGLAISKVDERSERNIVTLLPEVQPFAFDIGVFS